MSSPFGGDIFRSKGGWPYPGTIPPISTLADIFTKTDKTSESLRIGFAAWLFEHGTPDEIDAYGDALQVPGAVDHIDQKVADRIEAHFADYFWASEIDKYAVRMPDDRLAEVTVRGDVQIRTPVRYWSDDLRSYATDEDYDKYVPAGDVTPRLNYDRYYDAQSQNWEYITALGQGGPPTLADEVLPDFATVRYWNADLSEFTTGDNRITYQKAGDVRPRPHHDRYYNEKSDSWEFITGVTPEGLPILVDSEYVPSLAERQVMSPRDTSDLITRVPQIKNAVAYTAVRAKRQKELLADRPARKLMADAVGKMDGVKMIGEQFSMKGASSIVKKAIEESLSKSGADALLSAVDAISDGVRYTVMLPKDSYSMGVKNCIKYFLGNDWQNTKFANNWKNPLPSGYRGVNTKWMVMLDIAGQRTQEIIEVQFHTQESYDAKEDMTHAIKEEIRVLGLDVAELEKAVRAAQPESDQQRQLTQDLAAKKEALRLKDIQQRDIFEKMAAEHTPPEAKSIAL
jgi:hypothetical protein